MVVAAQVKDAVDGRLDEVRGVLGTDHDVAELARAGSATGRVDREREDVGGLVLAPVVAVQIADPRLADQLDREVPLQPGRRKRRLGRAPQLGVRCLDLGQAFFREAVRISGAWRSEYSL